MLMAGTTLRGYWVVLKPSLEVRVTDTETRAQLVGAEVAAIDSTPDDGHVKVSRLCDLARRQEVATRCSGCLLPVRTWRVADEFHTHTYRLIRPRIESVAVS
jgi:hypothetical protein